MSTLFDVFCVSGAFVGENGKLELSGATIDYKKLATKMFVYVKEHGVIPINMEDFFENYCNDKKDLDENSIALVSDISKKEDFFPEKQKQLEIKEKIINYVATCLENGENINWDEIKKHIENMN